MNLTEISSAISSFLAHSDCNRIPKLGGIRIYDDPILGVASGDDPLFLQLKESDAVGAFHHTPRECFAKAESVISYFLPFSRDIRISNRTGDATPSLGWLYGRIEGEAVNNDVRRVLANCLADSGGQTVIPPFESTFKIVERKSNWSERHVAFIAGLGTFSLSKSLITEKGCAGRFGSVLTNLPFQPTARKYRDVYEYCSMCMACAKRCPANAIDRAGKRHQPCADFLDTTMKRFAPRYGCGKCQTNVPCEHGIPKNNRIDL